MKLNIAVLAGDGIGPEIMKQGVAVMQAIAEKFNHEFTYNEAICGAHAIDEVGDPFPEATFKTCMDADAVLFAAVGDPRFDNNPTAKVRPEQGLLTLFQYLTDAEDRLQVISQSQFNFFFQDFHSFVIVSTTFRVTQNYIFSTCRSYHFSRNLTGICT